MIFLKTCKDQDLVFSFAFSFSFFSFSTIFNYDKVIIKLGEGATLLQSLAIIYWVLDTGIFGIDNIICKSFTIFTFIFSLFAIFNSLTYFILTNPFRLILSIWSSIITLILTIDNAIKVFYIQDILNGFHISCRKTKRILIYFTR